MGAIEDPVSLDERPTKDKSKEIKESKLFTIPNDTIFEPLDEEIQQESSETQIPDGGYGWVCVACLLGINAMTWGINTTYGVFSAFYLDNNHYKATRLDYAWVGGLSIAVCDLCGPLANYLTQKFNFKVPMVIGAICITLGQCMAGICHSFGPFLFCQGVVFGLGLGLILVPSYPILSHWFHRNLALAQGLSNAGSGIGGVIMNNVTSLLLQRIGVKWTLVTNGCICCAVIMPSIFFLRGRHSQVNARTSPFAWRFLIHPGYRWVLLWAILTMMAYFIAIYSLASYATDGLHLTTTQGGAIQSMLSAGQIVGRPLVGYALDRGGRVNMVIASYIICGVATLALWMPSRSFAVLAVYALLQGMFGGTIAATSTPIAASIVGVSHVGSALAMYWIVMAVPSLCAQPISILLVEYSMKSLGRTGAAAYTISIGMTGGLALFGAVILFGAKRYLQGGDMKLLRKV